MTRIQKKKNVYLAYEKKLWHKLRPGDVVTILSKDSYIVFNLIILVVLDPECNRKLVNKNALFPQFSWFN